jgi:hypothetical protein
MLPEMKQLEIGTSSLTCLQFFSSPFMMARSGAGGMAEEEEQEREKREREFSSCFAHHQRHRGGGGKRRRKKEKIRGRLSFWLLLQLIELLNYTATVAVAVRYTLSLNRIWLLFLATLRT